MLVGDTESDSFKFESTLIWVICEYDLTDKTFGFSFDSSIVGFDLREMVRMAMGEVKYRFYNTHKEHLEFIQENGIITHNYYQHDKPLIKRLFPWYKAKEEGDTYILSQLFNPDREIPKGERGAHGLAAWGIRFGIPKPKYDEWHRFSKGMLHRVIEDVKINIKTHYALAKEREGWDWDLAVQIEYGIADIQGRQEMHGVLLDQEKAYTLADEIYTDIQIIDEKLKSEMPLLVVQGTEVNKPFVKHKEQGAFLRNGSLRPELLEWYGHNVDPLMFKGKLCLTRKEVSKLVEAYLPNKVWGKFTKVEFKETNLNAPTQLKDFLITQGWVPLKFTEKGSPKLTEDSYGSIQGELGQLIAKRAVLKHRAGMIFGIRKKDSHLTGWLNIMRSDGRVEAGAITNSTPTGRMAHRGIVNCPKPKDKLWKSRVQLRDLFIVPDDKEMMGIDADGLESRCEAEACFHFKGGEAYAHELIDGDIHSSTAFKNGAMTQDEYDFFYKYKVEGLPIPDIDKAEYKRLGEIRDFWKAPKYALSYGAKSPRLMETIGITPPRGCTKKCWVCPVGRKKSCEGNTIFEGFWENNTALSEFKETITGAWKKRKESGGGNFVKGIDGRKLFVRFEHSIVNIYLQNMGSMVVKLAAIYLDKWCRQRKMYAQQVLIVHDELEMEILPSERKILKEIAPKAFIKAGEYLGIKVPMTGTPEFGRSWADVH